MSNSNAALVDALATACANGKSYESLQQFHAAVNRKLLKCNKLSQTQHQTEANCSTNFVAQMQELQDLIRDGVAVFAATHTDAHVNAAFELAKQSLRVGALLSVDEVGNFLSYLFSLVDVLHDYGNNDRLLTWIQASEDFLQCVLCFVREKHGSDAPQPDRCANEERRICLVLNKTLHKKVKIFSLTNETTATALPTADEVRRLVRSILRSACIAVEHLKSSTAAVLELYHLHPNYFQSTTSSPSSPCSVFQDQVVARVVLDTLLLGRLAPSSINGTELIALCDTKALLHKIQQEMREYSVGTFSPERARMESRHGPLLSLVNVFVTLVQRSSSNNEESKTLGDELLKLHERLLRRYHLWDIAVGALRRHGVTSTNQALAHLVF